MASQKLYPLKFTPIIKEKIWGGQKLKELFNKDFIGQANGGESWELSSVTGDISVVANGSLQGATLTELIAEYKEKLVGKVVYDNFGNEFPLLIKYIDANDDLSVQVHPDDKLAKLRHNSFGKTEMWYVLEADKGAELISGFSQTIAPNEYQQLLDDGKFIDVLAKHKVGTGDIYFMPAGRIHAIGRGVMVAEIQQTSDVTYRVYDYDRRDASGNGRQLHVDEALEAINFKDKDSGKIYYLLSENGSTQLVDCPYFKTKILKIKECLHRDYADIDSFVILMCVEGGASVDVGDTKYLLNFGETMLIPAEIETLSIMADNAKLLEVHV